MRLASGEKMIIRLGKSFKILKCFGVALPVLSASSFQLSETLSSYNLKKKNLKIHTISKTLLWGNIKMINLLFSQFQMLMIESRTLNT